MLTVATRPTAKVIQFPKRGRLGFAGHLSDRQSAANASTAPVLDCFGSWYHEEAVRAAAELAHKR